MCPKEVKRKKPPKAIALIEQNGCTGCEVCIYFCPVAECIIKTVGLEFSELTGVSEVVAELCIGCGLCVRECPWEAIQMIPVASLSGAASSSPSARTAEGEMT